MSKLFGVFGSERVGFSVGSGLYLWDEVRLLLVVKRRSGSTYSADGGKR
jgi:hypothetical protein